MRNHSMNRDCCQFIEPFYKDRAFDAHIDSDCIRNSFDSMKLLERFEGMEKCGQIV